MEGMPNVSLFLTNLPLQINTHELKQLIQETCHIGEVENIELFDEEFSISPTISLSAHIRFRYWYPTLGNDCLLEKLEEFGQFPIPYLVEDNVHVINAHTRNHVFPHSVHQTGAESLEFMEETKGDSDGDSDGEEAEAMDDDIAQDIEQMMGNESFDWVDAKYAAYLERQLFAITHSQYHSTAPIQS